MTTPLRPCGRPECVLCNPRRRPPHARPAAGEERRETLAMALLGAACIVALFLLVFVVLPIIAPGAPW